MAGKNLIDRPGSLMGLSWISRSLVLWIFASWESIETVKVIKKSPLRNPTRILSDAVVSAFERAPLLQDQEAYHSIMSQNIWNSIRYTRECWKTSVTSLFSMLQTGSETIRNRKWRHVKPEVVPRPEVRRFYGSMGRIAEKKLIKKKDLLSLISFKRPTYTFPYTGSGAEFYLNWHYKLLYSKNVWTGPHHIYLNKSQDVR